MEYRRTPTRILLRSTTLKYRQYSRGMATLALLIGLFASTATASSLPAWATNGLKRGDYQRSRENPVIAERFERYISENAAETVRIWVFFTDKNLASKGGFSSAASSIELNDRALRRRAKVDLTEPVMADLPVSDDYIAAVEQLGGKLRRSSRWLNAASFEIPGGAVERLTALPFVAEVRLLGRFVSPNVPEEGTRPEQQPSPQSEEYDRDYGGSLDQLEQINVPAAHDAGYSGAGVTLAMIDAGFRKSHDAFAQHHIDGRVLAEYDFVYDDNNVGHDDGDYASETSHGTGTWSVAAGYDEGVLYGPAFGADFILCKTEDIRSETNVEEDNWVAAVEWSSGLGADVISTSLGYFTFDASCACDYTYEDMDGQTAITSVMASMCDAMGIVLVKSAGNSGPSAGSVTAPADAFDILAVGSVYSSGTVYPSSSRGPTYDGRTKPEVCARGASTWAATINGDLDDQYTERTGTSFAAPLIGGAACLVVEAHPDWRPHQVREAIMASGDNASTPDNDYGWGVPDIMAAIAMSPGCCRGKVGNVVTGSDADPNIADVSALIDYLFGRFTPVDCLAEADINGSGSGELTRADITIGDVSMLIDYLFISVQPLPDCY